VADTTGAYRCSFCGKRQEDVDLLIAGTGGAYICEECAELAHEAVQKHCGRLPIAVEPTAEPPA
jgi:ATP-dependent protease Clp ATPase subunit